MLLKTACLLAGAWLCTRLSDMPPQGVPEMLCVLAVLLCAIPRARHVSLVLAGFSAFALEAQDALSGQLAPDLAGTPLDVTVYIAGFPAGSDDARQFVARPVNQPELPRLLRLSWFDPQTRPEFGETWRLCVQLRSPRGTANPGGFDYERWLLREGIGATGYVCASRAPRRIDVEPDGTFAQLRRDAVRRISSLVANDEASAVLLAVSVGARHRIDASAWDRYAATGTSHLVAISGLHIGIAASAAFGLGWLVATFALPRRSALGVASLAAVAGAGLYAALSGFAIPAQRAFMMLALAVAFLCYRRRPAIATVVALPCCIMFVANPFVVLAPGFALSYAAVLVILHGAAAYVRPIRTRQNWIRASSGAIRRLVTLQFALLFGLFPLTVAIFDRFSLVAPFVNLVVLPLFNTAIVPAALAGLMFDGWTAPVGDWLIRLAWRGIELKLRVIARAADLSPDTNVATDDGVALAIAWLALCHVALPSGWPGRRIALLALCVAATYRPASPPTGCFRYTMLDVGQGLAVVVQTARRTLLYDTGPAFRGGSSMAELVVLPYLRRLGVPRLDLLLVSHGDNDHAGGADVVINGIEVEATLGETAAEPCRAGQAWLWDGIRFTVLHPRHRAPWSGNNASCILRIDTGEEAMLLTGDIEAPVEKLLLWRNAIAPASIVVVPHHGSATSSSHDFVAATGAGIALVSTAHDNRWSLPRAEIVRRWSLAGADVLTTAGDGALRQLVCRSGRGKLTAERQTGRKFFHRRP